jgi:hypothetical protein
MNSVILNIDNPKYVLSIFIDDNLNSQIYVGSEMYIIFGAVFCIGLIVVLIKSIGIKSFELDEAVFGSGNQKIKIRPNRIDQQIVYKIWVELSTRKIGLPIDLNNDVIVELYNSWFSFFSVIRELIKDVPVQKFKRKDTERIVRLSIEILNEGIRPHLTCWHAKFRRWYENELKKDGNIDKHPQDIQKEFPLYNELVNDLILVNERLINYKEKMYQLIIGS